MIDLHPAQQPSPNLDTRWQILKPDPQKLAKKVVVGMRWRRGRRRRRADNVPSGLTALKWSRAEQEGVVEKTATFGSNSCSALRAFQRFLLPTRSSRSHFHPSFSAVFGWQGWSPMITSQESVHNVHPQSGGTRVLPNQQFSIDPYLY